MSLLQPSERSESSSFHNVVSHVYFILLLSAALPWNFLSILWIFNEENSISLSDQKSCGPGYIYIYNSIKYLNFCPLVFLTAENFHHFNGLCIMEVYVYIMAGAHSHRNTKCAEVYTSVPMNICLPKCDVLPSESLPTFQRILLAHQHGTSTRPHCTKHQNTWTLTLTLSKPLTLNH